ncbi:MAG: hypothetical protein ACYS7M_04580 [Planctomycetota bacterium]|jgi:hypothetical protein
MPIATGGHDVGQGRIESLNNTGGGTITADNGTTVNFARNALANGEDAPGLGTRVEFEVELHVKRPWVVRRTLRPVRERSASASEKQKKREEPEKSEKKSEKKPIRDKRRKSIVMDQADEQERAPAIGCGSGQSPDATDVPMTSPQAVPQIAQQDPPADRIIVGFQYADWLRDGEKAAYEGSKLLNARKSITGYGEAPKSGWSFQQDWNYGGQPGTTKAKDNALKMMRAVHEKMTQEGLHGAYCMEGIERSAFCVFAFYYIGGKTKTVALNKVCAMVKKMRGKYMDDGDDSAQRTRDRAHNASWWSRLEEEYIPSE